MLKDSREIFSRKLYGVLAQGAEKDNVFCSAFSISTAIAMVYAGSSGETRAELEEVFGYAPGIEKYMSLLTKSLEERRDVDISVANAVWGAEDLDLNPDYVSTLEEAYKIEGGIRRGISEGAVNSFVKGATKGLIPKIVDDLSPESRLVLVNAIYFLGMWHQQFDKKKTMDRDFYNMDGSTSDIRMMYTKMNKVDYDENDLYQAISLPYRGRDVVMNVILPKPGMFAEVESQYALGKVDLSTMRRAKNVHTYIPQFELEEKYEMNEYLAALGMTNSFSNFAQFDLMTMGERLKIDRVIHKAVVKVNEEGTEAAAATMVGMVRCTSVARPEPMIVFNAERPFLFEIRDNNAGVTLFAGRVSKL